MQQNFASFVLLYFAR